VHSLLLVWNYVTGVTTSELDELASQTAASLSTKHPHFGKLAARISVSNLHKNTPKAFSDVVTALYNYVHPKTGSKAGLIAEDVYQIVMANKDRLNSAIISDRDCELCNELDSAYLLFVVLRFGYIVCCLRGRSAVCN
jgi:ATP cone domain